MIDLDERIRIVAAFPHKPGRKRLLASRAGYGFVLPEDEAVAFRRAGKQVLNLDEGGQVALCLEAEGDHVAVVGDAGKALIFPLAELPEMARGKGVKLQAYREDQGLRDALVFGKADGPTYLDNAGKRRDWKDWAEWLGRRAGAGRTAPKPLAASKRFNPR